MPPSSLSLPAVKANQSVDRALDTLTLLKSGSRTITEVSRELKVHPSTGLRLLASLENKGFVKRSESGLFSLGPRLIDLGYAAIENIDLRQTVRPFIESLALTTGEAVHLAILGFNKSVFYIDKVDSSHPVRMYSRIGLSAPLHCTGVGKALLVGLPASMRADLFEDYEFKVFTETTRKSSVDFDQDLAQYSSKKFVVDDAEHEKGIHCIAAPIKYHDGSLAGAISISAPESRVSKPELLSYATLLQNAISQIEQNLGTY